MIVPTRGIFALVCRHHENKNETKRLHPHPPRRPFHNLSAVGSDQLSPCIMQPRLSRISKSGKFNSVFGMNIQQASYVGVDSMNVTTEGRFKKHNIIIMEHEALSVAGRDDINSLLSRKVEEGEILPELARSIREISKVMYPEGSLNEYIDGAMYVPLNDSMILQMDAAEENLIDVIMKRRVAGTSHTFDDVHECYKRSWDPTINYMQMEDKDLYGYPFKPIVKYNCKPKQPSMMLWCLCGIISVCKELYQLIDKKQDGFRYDGWEGYMMTHIHHTYIYHSNITYPK